ncbi:TetR/AcrR family transcriptional regulator [Thermomonospora amylolytica]|uniref:TetR/AcrR family transcriptional regulator n=1 Tax=Thermomonospora amylolytica TaxID=1411117 RepID=UPI000E6BE424|nr:TetR/AcrR family transcriptional regulator [Thermomonospora amylolytica]
MSSASATKRTGRAESATGGRPPGRRERKKEDTRRRIIEAATALFAERGYQAVTTSEIAEAADIGAGTLFRYADSKAELLVMVINERLRLGAARGIELADGGATPTDAILALLAPLAQASLGHPENAIVYQRETLFGTGPHRELAAAYVADLEEAILQILTRYAETHPVRPDVDLAEAAHAIYSTMYMDLVRVGLGRATVTDLPTRLRRSVDFLVHTLLDPPPGNTP